MARNVEIKASVTDFARVTAALATLSPGPGVALEQEDTFFDCPRGRLKLRRFSAELGQLIYYERPDQPGPKTSDYVITATTEPDRLRDVLAAAYGIVGVVCKRRLVRMVGRTRVHLDEVEGLGRFVELEVVLEEGEPIEQGLVEAHGLMAALEIQPEQLVSHAYLDLLPGAGSGPPR
jgi:predicted adenylyl cyclase CyaB